MTTIGPKVTSAPQFPVLVVDDTGSNQVASNYGGSIQSAVPGWVTVVGLWCRRLATTSKVYLAVWSNKVNDDPDLLLGRTALLSAPASASNLQAAIAATSGPSPTAIRLAAGQAVHLGFVAQGGDLEAGTVFIGPLDQLYRRAVGASTPTSPFAPSSSTTPLSHPAMYVEFTANSAPNAPANLSPNDATSTTDATPTLSGEFSDPDTGAPTLDLLWAYEFEARDNGNDTLLWGGATALFAANATEQASGAFSRPYNGTPLIEGQTIKWRARCYDLSGTPGAWSAYRTLTLDALPDITMSAPTGKIDGPTEEIGWAGTYVHPSAEPSTHMQVRILKDGVVYREGAEFASVVASGNPFSIDAASDGDVGFLGSGLALAVQMRAKAGGVWGPWSAPLSFATNALPTRPTILQPPSGSSSTSRPLLTWRSSDADDTEGTEVTWEVEVTRPDLQVFTYPVADYDATAGEGFLQTTATHLPAPDPLPYSWRVRADDVSASDGLSEWSDPATFLYSSGVVVTITSPTEGAVLADATPTVTFTLSSGTLTHKRLLIYPKDAATPKYDSGLIASSSLSFVVPAGVLLNGNAYDLVVMAINDSAAEGTSARRQISVGFAAPDGVVAPECSPFQFAGDPEPTAVLFSWSPATLPLDQFRGYAVRRRRNGEALAEATLLKVIGSVAQSRWLDANAPADGPHIYSASVLKRQGSQTVESVPAEAEIDLDLRVVVVSAATGDTSRRAVLRWKPNSGQPTRRREYEQQAEDYQTWGGKGLPTALFGTGTQRIVNGTFLLVSDESAEREQHWANLEALYLARVPVIYRDDRVRFFGRIETFSAEQHDNKDTISLKVAEIAFHEGEDASGIAPKIDG